MISLKAEPYTISIVRKIRPEMLVSQAKEFILLCAKASIGAGIRNKNLVSNKLRELRDSNLVLQSDLKIIMDKIIRLFELNRGDDDFQELYEDIYQLVFPHLSSKRQTSKYAPDVT